MLHNLKIIVIMILCIIEHKSDQISDPFNGLKIKKKLNKTSIGFCRVYKLLFSYMYLNNLIIFLTVDKNP